MKWKMFRIISDELRKHAPFTFFGTLTGLLIMGAIVFFNIPNSTSKNLFLFFHPVHVFFSAMVTTAMYCLHHKQRSLIKILIIGYLGSVGIGTLSDCIIPYFGEWMLNLPNRGLHIGFINKWWLVNPLAVAGIVVAYNWPETRFPHMFHVLISTWASLFHMTTAFSENISLITFILVAFFLFLAVWLPCCTSDIVFPLLFQKGETERLIEK